MCFTISFHSKTFPVTNNNTPSKANLIIVGGFFNVLILDIALLSIDLRAYYAASNLGLTSLRSFSTISFLCSISLFFLSNSSPIIYSCFCFSSAFKLSSSISVIFFLDSLALASNSILKFLRESSNSYT